MNDLPLFIAARRTDPVTSQAGRDAFKKKASQRDVILMTYYDEWWRGSADGTSDGGLMDEEAGMKTPWKNSTMYDERICYWKRCSELRKLGFIHPTGSLRMSSQGMDQQVCRITDDGRAYIDTLLRRGIL